MACRVVVCGSNVFRQTCLTGGRGGLACVGVRARVGVGARVWVLGHRVGDKSRVHLLMRRCCWMWRKTNQL